MSYQGEKVTKLILNKRQQYDLEMLLVNGFAPLTGFLVQTDYESVLTSMRLTDGQFWPMPITLDVPDEVAAEIELQKKIELFDIDNTLLARMTVTSKWQPNKAFEAQQVFGTQDCKHPGVNYLFNFTGNWYVGGALELVKLPTHFDFVELRLTPNDLKQTFASLGWEKIVAFQTRNPLHRAHFEMTLRAAKEVEASILIHPVVGVTKPGDVDYFTRVCCYEKMMHYYPPKKAFLSLLPLAMRMAGPREALWHAVIRRNYGCTHFIVGRDHAGPGKDSSGKSFYDPYAAQKFALIHQDEIGITIMPFQEMVYVKERKRYCSQDELKDSETALSISGTQLRNALLKEEHIPEWFSFPEILQVLRESYLPRHKQGFTLFFTGLSGSGKTTLARALIAKLMRYGKKNVTYLDGDVIRRILASELGFSKADRDLNIRRIGFVASEVTKAGGVAVCAAIAPYANVRKENRQLISQYGQYIEIYVSTSLEVCAQRDTKGLYAKAQKGEIKGFTGVNDPYETPVNPEITIDTGITSIEKSVERVIDFLRQEGYLQWSPESINSSVYLAANA